MSHVIPPTARVFPSASDHASFSAFCDTDSASAGRTRESLSSALSHIDATNASSRAPQITDAGFSSPAHVIAGGRRTMVDPYHNVKHSTTHPKFLHSNSTSHRWVFGAIAELIDNALDPDVSASQFCIDMKDFGGVPCLVFMDNGCGLSPEKLHRMLSFGHSKKQLNPGDKSIGKHGNGFKSGTMRLGKDVLVLTKCANSMTVGFLSQTFLVSTGAEDIIIPQVSWDLAGNRLHPNDPEIDESLKAICKYSIFSEEESLLAQLDAIPITGAILIISNLRRHEGVLELDFDTDLHDIRISSEISSSHFQQLRPNQPNTTDVPMDYSLRAYVSILYKVPRMQIFIRDKKVKTKRIGGTLSQKEVESYKPYGVAESIDIELGFNTENKKLYGMMLYHRNRLIKAYMRVGMQLEENERGMGVVGLAEADFLHPTHNKQDFDDTTAYRRLLKKLADVLAEYWWEKKERVQGQQLPIDSRMLRRGVNVSSSEDVPDVIWVQCDNPSCLKWRILPPGTDVSILPDIWYCEYHPLEKYQNHAEPEQEWDPSVQHESRYASQIIERRKERKREYDQEKKEREAERKRQKQEAASRENQEALLRQKDTLTKEIQIHEVRGELAQKEMKLREEQMEKLREEHNALLAARDALSRQLEQSTVELPGRDKSRNAVDHGQEVHLDTLEDVPAATTTTLENGHVDRRGHSSTEGGSDRTAAQQRKRQGRPNASKSPLPDESISGMNGNVHGHDRNGTIPRTPLENPRSAASAPKPTPSKSKEHQVPKSSHDARTSIEAPSKNFNKRGSSGGSQKSQRKGGALSTAASGAQASPAEHKKGISKSANRSEQDVRQAGSLEDGLAYTPARSRFAQLDTLPVLARQDPLTSVGPVRSAEVNQSSLQADRRILGSGTAVQPSPAVEASTAELSSENSHRDQINGGRKPGRLGDIGNGQDSNSEAGASLSGLRMAALPEQNNNSMDSGKLSVHLPMDSMLIRGNGRSEAEVTLDKAVFVLQRRLRLALNTLIKLGGSERSLVELDLLPSVDGEVTRDNDEVVSICEQATSHVETLLHNGRQEVAKLKAELAYLMADKMQINPRNRTRDPAQGRNFKIQSIANKWEIGMDFAKQG